MTNKQIFPKAKQPNSLFDAHFEKDLNVLGRELITAYIGIGEPGVPKPKMLDVGAFADTHRLDVLGNQNYWDSDYYVLNLEGDEHPKFIKGDICNCPQIPDNSFDIVYSQDTFEHIDKPWLAAKEIARILKPRGVAYIVTLFAWRYHQAPEDYFRYTPFGLASLFDGMLMHLEGNFDGKNRRGLNGIGTQGDGDANDKVPEDMLGAWRENWRVYYLGQKPW